MRFKFNFRSIFGQAADQLFARALTHPDTFHGAARPILQGQSEGDIEKARALALEGMHTYLHVVKRHSDRFLHGYDSSTSYESLRIPFGDRFSTPVGTACGLDADAEGLEALSYLFGFQIPGPVTLTARSAATARFQDDGRRNDLYVPLDFSSRGLAYVVNRLEAYRKTGGQAVILPAVATGVGGSSDWSDAASDLQTMVTAMRPWVDGFVWVPSGRADFADAARLLRRHVPDRLKLVEMPAYAESERDAWLENVSAFLTNGGDGIVAVRGLGVPRCRVPDPVNWPLASALWCGASMGPYRQRAIEDTRRAFPSCFIIASGGFHQRDEAFRACEYANAIAENEAFTRFGPGLAPVLLNKLALRLKFLQRKGLIESIELAEFQRLRWSHLPEHGSLENR